MRQVLKKKLGDLLVQAGKITENQLNEALSQQKTTGKRLGKILSDNGLVTEEDILLILEIQLGISRVYLDFIEIDTKAVRAISKTLAEKYTIIPAYIRDERLFLVMSDPLNIFAIDDVRIASGYDIEPLIATSEEIKKAIAKHYSSEAMQKAVEEFKKEHTKTNVVDNIEDEENLKNAPVVKIIDSIFDNAVKEEASDIHIEPYESYIRIRYRIDGKLKEVLRTPKETLAAMITRIKILSSLDIAEKRIPQDGRIIGRYEGIDIDFRISVLPTVHGEKVVIRVLRKNLNSASFEELGMYNEDKEKINRISQNPHGIILVTGPTGSGKSTSLYTILSELNKVDTNIITVEDPVEYMLEGINQVSVNVKAGLTFAMGLRSILRQDPDVIMIGEIRDGETAEIAVRSAITGHLVLSSIHTNDAPSSTVRLLDMGIEPYLIATSVVGVIAQRLVRKICPHCKEEYEANDYEKKLLSISQSKKVLLTKGVGCSYCNNTGYKGRMGVYEVMEIGREERESIMNKGSVDELRDIAIKNGMTTLAKSAAKLVLDGKTTLDEMIRITYIN